MGDVIAVPADHGNHGGWIDAHLPEKRAVLGFDTGKPVRIAGDQVHLVHQNGQLPDAEHRGDVPVAAGIFLHAFARIDDDQRGVRPGGARDHVLQQVDVTGCIDDDVVARLRAKEHARRVDRDALCTLVLQRVEQERVFERLRCPVTERFDLIDLARRQRAAVRKQAADDRALAMIDVAANDDGEAIARRRHSVTPNLRRSASAKTDDNPKNATDQCTCRPNASTLPCGYVTAMDSTADAAGRVGSDG